MQFHLDTVVGHTNPHNLKNEADQHHLQIHHHSHFHQMRKTQCLFLNLLHKASSVSEKKDVAQRADQQKLRR
jgi:hypothetical protein